MKKYPIIFGIFLLSLFFVLGGCQEEPAAPYENYADFIQNLEVVSDGGSDSGTKIHRNFSAIMSGDRNVPERDSKGHGVVKMKLSNEGDTISYFLNVSNLSNVVGAHIHRGGYGNNGPVVASLYSAAPGGGQVHGRLTTGYFTPADLVGPFAGSENFDFFIDELHLDSLYVNVHTDDGEEPHGETSGDFPQGEIRGQLRSAPYGGIGVKDSHF